MLVSCSEGNHFILHLHQPLGKPLTTTSKSELSSLCVSDICIRISPWGKKTEGEKVLWPFSHVPKEADQQRAAWADELSHGCESPRNITKHCSLHLVAFPPRHYQCRVTPAHVMAGPVLCCSHRCQRQPRLCHGLWVSALPQPLQAPFLNPKAPQLHCTFLVSCGRQLQHPPKCCAWSHFTRLAL